MTTKRYSPECMDRHFIALGKEGEGNHLALRFDTAVWREAYPEAEILLWVTPPVGEGYFAELAEQSGDVIWTVTSGDTEHEGSGEIELILRDAQTGTTIKSATARTLVKSSPSHAEGGDPPEAHKPWWERLLDMISGVVRTINGVKPDADGNIDIEVIGGGANEEQVREIVDERLTEAKESGEFKGDKGEKGDRGDVGPQGPAGHAGAKGDKGDKGDPGDDYILTDADKQEIAGMIPGGENAIVEDLFYVKLEEPVTEVIAKLTRRANHMFVLVYRPDEYEDAFYVYVYATDLQTMETIVSSETQITDGVRLEAGAAGPNYVNRFLCKLDFQGGLLSAYWGISPKEYQMTAWTFLNKPIKCTHPDGINKIILRNYVGDKLLPKGTVVRIVGA